MSEAILTAEECNVDVCVLGTGLTESLIAAALARREKRVLHLDRQQSYGGNWRALSLADFEKWGNGQEEADLIESFSGEAEPTEDISRFTVIDVESEAPLSCFRWKSIEWDPFKTKSEEELEELQKDVRKKSNSYNIDLVPRLLFSRSDLVDVLVESGVARYLEFQGLKSARVYSTSGLLSVPMTKGEIFQDPVLTLPEKRILMRFITSMMPFVGSLAFHSPAQLGVDQARQVQAPNDPTNSLPENIDLDESWSDFLKKQKLSQRLQDFVTYAICMWDGSPQNEKIPLSTREGLRCLGRFVSSLGLHGRGTSMPLLYPMYGASEIAQGFTRMCALHRGTYALRTAVTKILVERSSDSDSSCIAGVVTNRGEVIKCRSVVASRDYTDLSAAAAKRRQDADAEATQGTHCIRMTIIADCALVGEDGLGVCVVPPSSMDPPLANVVQVLQLDFSTGTCPKDFTVVHLTQVAPNGVSDKGAAFNDLQRVLEALLEICGGRHHCLVRCTYIHQSRETWEFSDPAVEALKTCCDNRTLSLCSDPSVVPQMLSEPEIEEARTLFLRCSIHGDETLSPEDFLEKPVHVALEEQSSAMDELAAFNEQMQEAAQPKPEVAASLEQHAEQEEQQPSAAVTAVVGPDTCEGKQEEQPSIAVTDVVGPGACEGKPPPEKEP